MQPNAQIILVGNITEPDLKFAASGTAFVKFSVPVTERKKEGDSWVDGITSWYRCTAFGQMAENISESCPKGTRVIVRGTIKMDEWEDKEGNKRLSPDVMVDDVGVELRFATASVNRIERSESTRGNEGSGSNPPPFL